MKIKHFLAAAALVCTPLAALAAQVEIVNKSAWDIYEVYFSPASQDSWGDDYLGTEVLENGDSLTLSGVESGRWDVLVIDEDGDECIINNVSISGSDRWVITDDDLLACQAAS